jgi:hypothetical protein
LFGHDGSLPGTGFLGELPHKINPAARLREQIRRLGYFALRPSSFSDIRRLSNAIPSPKTSAWHRARTRRYNDRRIRMALADLTVDIVPIVRPIAGKRRNRARNLLQQAASSSTTVASAASAMAERPRTSRPSRHPGIEDSNRRDSG